MCTGEWMVWRRPAALCSLLLIPPSLFSVGCCRWSGLRASRCGWLRSCKQTELGGEEAACGLSSQQVKRSAALRGASSTMMWRVMSLMASSTRVRISPWRASSPSAGTLATVGPSDTQCQPSSTWCATSTTVRRTSGSTSATGTTGWTSVPRRRSG